MQSIYRHTVLLIFAPQVYDNLLRQWTPEELLVHFLRKVYMEYTQVFLRHHRITEFIPPVSIFHLCTQIH